MNPQYFQRRIIPIILPDAGLDGDLAARLTPAQYWKQQEQELTQLIKENLELVSTSIHQRHRLIRDIALNTTAMIDYLLDQLQRRDYDRQIEEGFAELCHQILEG
jgi:hypothetical protein